MSTKNTYAILGVPFFTAFLINVNYVTSTIRFSNGCDCNINGMSGFPKIVETFDSYPEWKRLLIPDVACNWNNNTTAKSIAPSTTLLCLRGLIDFFGSSTTINDNNLASKYLAITQNNWSVRPDGDTLFSVLPAACDWPITLTAAWFRYSNLSTNALIILNPIPVISSASVLNIWPSMCLSITAIVVAWEFLII